VLDNGKGYLPSPVEAPDPAAESKPEPPKISDAQRAEGRAAMAASLERQRDAREAAVSAPADRIISYVNEHGRPPGTVVADALGSGTDRRLEGSRQVCACALTQAITLLLRDGPTAAATARRR
jgi:hypothetical protein